MISLKNKLFSLWLITIAFGHQFTAYSGFPSPDKLLTPVLLLIGLVILFQGSPERVRRVASFSAIVLMLLFVKNISFITSMELYFPMMKEDIVKFGYFFVPLLCIVNMDDFRRTSWYIVFIAFAGCVTPFLVSIGVMTLPIGWFEPSRIGGLLKTKGIFLSNGDLVQYIVFAAAWLILLPGIVKIDFKYKMIRWLFVLAVILALLGTQSRNIIVSMLIGLFIFWWLRKSINMSSAKKIVILFGFYFAATIMITFILLHSSEYYEAAVNVGGEYAKRTAETRLNQYSIAWDIIVSSPILGADTSTYLMNGHLIGYIHNIWFRLLAHGGIVTALVMLILLFVTYVKLKQVVHIKPKSLEGVIAISYFGSMLVALMFYVGLGVMYWAILGVVVALICIPPYVLNNSDDAVIDKSSTKDVFKSYTGVKLRSHN